MNAVLLIVLDHLTEIVPLLETGRRWLESGGGGRLKVLAVRSAPVSFVIMSEDVLTLPYETQIRTKECARVNQLRQVVLQWHEQYPQVAFEWLDIEGGVIDIICQQGQNADLIVMSRDMPDIRTILRDSKTPVLSVPLGYDKSFGATVAVAWKNDGRSARAIRAALPLLDNAAVHVLSVGTSATLPTILSDHDLEGELYNLPKIESISGTLLQEAHRLGADLLIMGGFAHGAWYEFFFGAGVTKALLAKADIPLLICH